MTERRLEIVLIGPTAVGKTTVGRCVAERLGEPLASMDAHRDRYYAELGFDPDLARRLFERDGAATYWCYCKTFDPYAIERFLDEHRGSVLDMGGGSSVHEHEDNLARAERALALSPDDRGVLYNLACFYSIAGEKGTAIDCLEKAAAVGRVSREWVEHDSDLDPIRDEPRYRALLEKI